MPGAARCLTSFRFVEFEGIRQLVFLIDDRFVLSLTSAKIHLQSICVWSTGELVERKVLQCSW